MRNSKPIDSLAVVVGLGCIIALGLSLRNSPPSPDSQLHRAIGVALATEASRLVGPGGRVVLISRDTEAFPQPALAMLLRSFHHELARVGVPIAATQLVQTDPLRPTEVPAGDFFELLRRAPAGHVVVSLLGPPLLTAEQQKKLGGVRAKVVVFCPGSIAETVDLRQLFQDGLVHTAIVSRPLVAGEQFASGHAAAFDKLYRVVRSNDRSEGTNVSLASP